MKIYLASALTRAPEDYKLGVQQLRDKLKTQHEVLDYFGLGPGTPNEVYLHDKKCIDQSDVVVAEVSQQSLGVGYEIGYALSTNKKVIALATDETVVGRMIKGITDPNYIFLTYKNADEVIKLLKKT